VNKSERLSQQLQSLEREYRTALIDALSECADGRWGLFGHNEHLGPYWNSAKLDELRGLARAINNRRERLGEPFFALHEEFEAARGQAGPNDPGEPKVAEAWLRRLSAA
jgi:hypothetical protein